MYDPILGSMKKLIVTLFCLLSTGLIQAQEFENKGNYATFGLGNEFFSSPVDNSFAVGSFIFNYERGISEVIGIGRIGIGATVGYSYFSGSHEGISADGSKLTVIARGTYHFEFNVPKMDVYAGVGAGGQFSNSDYFGRKFKMPHQIFAGIRYFFKPTFGVYGEFGHGSSVLNGGVVISF
jgi:hypothetical protein